MENDRVTIIGDTFDQYNRRLAEIYTKDGLNINLELIRNGLALPYYLGRNRECDQVKYLNFEKLAKKEKLNIWSDQEFLEPWKYRKRKKIKQKEL